jgi:hypothetical protein
MPVPRLAPGFVFPVIVEFTAVTDTCGSIGVVPMPPPRLLLTVELVRVTPGPRRRPAVGQDDVGLDVDLRLALEGELELSLGRHHDRTGRLGQSEECCSADRRGVDKSGSAATKHGGTLSASVYVDRGR